MRNKIAFYINGRRVTVSDKRAFMPLADFLREEKGLKSRLCVLKEIVVPALSFKGT